MYVDSRSTSSSDDHSSGEIIVQLSYAFAERHGRLRLFVELMETQTEFVRIDNRRVENVRFVPVHVLILIVDGRVQREAFDEFVDRVQRTLNEEMLKLFAKERFGEVELNRTAAE